MTDSQCSTAISFRLIGKGASFKGRGSKAACCMHRLWGGKKVKDVDLPHTRDTILNEQYVACPSGYFRTVRCSLTCGRPQVMYPVLKNEYDAYDMAMTHSLVFEAGIQMSRSCSSYSIFCFTSSHHHPIGTSILHI